MAIRSAISKAAVSDILNDYQISDDDLVAVFPDLAKAVQELPGESPPDA